MEVQCSKLELTLDFEYVSFERGKIDTDDIFDRTKFILIGQKWSLPISMIGIIICISNRIRVKALISVIMPARADNKFVIRPGR